MFGKYKGSKVVVHRLWPENVSYLEREMARLDGAAKLTNDEEARAAMQLAWSALHFAHGAFERAVSSSSFASFKMVSGKPTIRIGRAHSVTMSWGARSQGRDRPWRRTLWLQAFGFSVGVRLWNTETL